MRNLVFWFSCFIAIPILASAGEEIEFNRDVRPILSNHCFTCHGPDSATREAGVRLDKREAAIGKADSGESIIVPGNAAKSELIRRVSSHDADIRMPPADGAKRLTDQQIATLTAWINQGAEYETHWSFLSPKKVAAPDVAPSTWPKNDIDRFVLARLQKEGLKPMPPASRETLVRRVAFDLTGLPPTIQQVEAFVNDGSEEAYQRLVSELIDSPAYGEHMARHWLDLARYADSNGYQYDTERQQWVWRDWVIHAYNQNKPFDEFTVEQLAGDLLPNASPQQILATGFNRNHGITIEGGIIDEEYRTEYVMDRLTTTGEVWLGLTIGCARCHEHKFDPISQKEFYQLYAFFNQVPERGMRGFAPTQQIASPLAASQQQETKAELARLKLQLNAPLNVEEKLNQWAKSISDSKTSGWKVLAPTSAKSSGGSTLTRQDDNSLLVGGANPGKDVYEINARTSATKITAIRLEALTHQSLPGGGPGRHTNSNFVLSEFEATAVSTSSPKLSQPVKFKRAIADYSQKGYEISRAINGTISGNDGWAVDGPTRKENATAIFIAETPFGYDGGTELQFRLRHEANFATHGIGRPRFSFTTDAADDLTFGGVPADILAIANRNKDERTTAESKQLRDYFLANHHPHETIKQRIAALEKRATEAFPSTMVMQEMPKPRTTRLLYRGQYNEPREAVAANVPAVFPAMGESLPKNRLGFAKWLVDEQNPLTARVAVNRYWQRMFGVGLVKTSEDFGVQGELPSHPELLDWLASEFVRSGWNVKHMQRLIVSSATYRQSSHAGAAAYKADPENRLLARGPHMRLDAEEIRDSALAVSGLLKNQVGGKSVYPYQPKGLWLELNNRPGYSKAYPQGVGDEFYRRSLYTFWKRTVPSPMLKTFDAPEREFCTIRRSRTNTPLQALLLLNGTQYVEAARHLAVRMLNQQGTPDEQLAFGFQLVTARQPNTDELRILEGALAAEQKRFAEDAASAKQLLEVGDSNVVYEFEQAELAAMTSVARLILNLNEAITKG